jgi:hypothetical protein
MAVVLLDYVLSTNRESILAFCVKIIWGLMALFSQMKKQHGGKRKGAGRKKGFRMKKSQLKEKTKVRRVPIGILDAVDDILERYKESIETQLKK